MSGVKLVLPAVPSVTPDLPTVAASPGILEVVDELKPVLSEIWNSYIRAPVWSEVALRTTSVGRSVSSCSPLPGVSGTGAPRFAVAGAGVVGVSLPPHPAATAHRTTPATK